MLSNRCKEILQELLVTDGFVTVNDISDKLGVSSRTILRTMDEVSDWFREHGVEFQKKKGTGLRVFEDDTRKQELLDTLYDEQADVVYSPEERKIIIKAKLLADQEPIKLYVFSRIFDVTEGTVSNDLLYVEPWLASFSLDLVKRQGLGIYVQGEEQNIRKAIVALIYEHFQIQGLLNLLMEKKNQSDSFLEIERKLDTYVLNLMDIESIDEIHGLLAALETYLGYRFADQGYIALLIRMSLTIRRASGSTLDVNTEDPIYKCMKAYIEKNGERLNTLSDYELYDLVRFVKGTKYANQSDKRISMVKDFKTIQLAKNLITEMEKNTGIYLSDNPKLLAGLVRHLGPAIYRMKNGLDIINPLMEEIKNAYPKLFKATRMSVHVIEEKEKVYVPDDEIAYLATHIGAIIRKSDREKIKKYQVVVACTYGIGASQLLLSNIERAFENLNVVEVVSVFDRGLDDFLNEDIDLIISTVPISNSRIPTVVIHPILKEQDILDIRNALEQIQPTIRKTKNEEIIPLKEKLRMINKYSDVIITILDNFSTKKVNAKNLNQVIDLASDLLTTTKQEEERLRKAFIQREEKGSTILGKKGVMLLHCRAEIKQNISVKVIQLINPIVAEDGETLISSVVIMVGPEEFDSAIIEVMSAVSRSIISGEFLESILSGDTEDMYRNLNNVLDQYVKEIINGVS